MMQRVKIISLLTVFFLFLNTPQAFAEDPNVHLNAARQYMENKQWTYASYEWRNVIAQEPKNPEANIGLAESLMKSGFPKDAISHLIQAQAYYQDPLLYLELAKAYRHSGDSLNAEKAYKTILDKNPFHSEAFKGLKSLTIQLPHENKSSNDSYLKKIADQAQNKAKAAIASGNYPEAANYYDIVSTYYPKVKAVNDYALLLLLAGRYQESARQINLLKKSTLWETYSNAAFVALSLNNKSKAIQNMEKSIHLCNITTQKGKLYNNLGYVYETSGHISKAIFAYEKALELNPSLTRAKLNLAYVYQKNQDYQKALDLYSSMTQVNPNNAEAWNLLGFTYELMNKPKLAISAYKKALSLDSQLKAAYVNLGTLFNKMGKEDEATAEFEKAIALDFKKMESGNRYNDSNQSKLFDYIDLFFMNNLTETTQETST